MLIIDRTQRDWAVASILICAVGGAAYFVYSTNALNGPSGGSVPGLIFGIVAAGMMVFAGLLAARRRFPAARMGNAQFWLRGHLWVGTLTIPFALFHAGFGLGGPLEQLLWILFFAVVLSGFWGLFLQQYLPRMMLEQIPRETFVEQVPHLCLKYLAESDRLLADVCGPLDVPLSTADAELVRPYLLPFFDEDRKKNRADYPKTLTEAEQFEIFFAKVYAGRNPSVAKAPASPAPATPTMKSVAHITAPERPIPAAPTTPAAATAVAEHPAEKPISASPSPSNAATKPDPKALLAAAKAKKAAAEQATSIEAPIEPIAATPAPSAVTGKPDPRAMLAAARAKKAGAESATVSTDQAASAPAAAVEATSPAAPSEPTGKPDPKAMLAAARAKKAGGTPEAAPTETNPAEQPAASSVSPSTTPAPTGKPDPKAMLAAARARKEGALAEPAPSTPAEAQASVAAPPAAPAGKPDPRAMLAAMKAKKEAAAGAQSSATQPSDAPPAVVTKPAAVKEPATARPTSASAAAKSTPPSPSQIAELKQIYLELVRPQLPLQPATRAWMDAIRRSVLACHVRQDVLHPMLIPIFDRLRDVCEQRRQFSFVLRYQRWLHEWLLIHIPATVAVYVILVVHAISALRVIPFGN